MTISTTIIKNSYSGDASNDTFAYQFKISTTADMEVIIRTAAAVETVKTLTTHYTVTGAGTASGGNVVFESGHIPAATETVILRRSTTQTQALDLVENDPFTADSVESAFDKNLALIQELQEESTRAIKLSKSNTMTSTEFTVAAAARASKVLAFDSNGELSVTQELGTYQGTSATTTTAAHVIRDLVKGSTAAQLNNIYICIQASPIGTALTNTSYWVLIVNAVAAATSATAAATSATASAASAVDATNNGAAKVTLAAAQVTLATAQVALGTTQANNSATSATASASSATAGASSASAAASSATAAAASADAFDDIYLGAKSSAPSVDNDGDALTTGDQYFNTSANQLNIWNGSAWQIAAISASGLATIVGTETLTNKTLTLPKIAEIVSLGSGDITLDAEADINLEAATDVNIPANVGLTFGDDGEKIEGNGTLLTISSSQNLVLDAANDLKLDSGGNIYVLDDGGIYGHILRSGTQAFKLRSHVSDADLILEGSDGGSVIAALTLDMSAAGAATFNSTVTTTGLTLGSTAVTSTAAELNILDALDRGSIVYGNASGVTAVLNNGSNGQFLTTDGTDISWGAGSSADFGAIGEHALPTADDTYDLGSASRQWRNIYTGDLHLSNESKAEGNKVDGTTGNWTIQEGADDLFILNNKSGKKYKFNLTEV